MSRCRCLQAMLATVLLGGLLTGCGVVHHVPPGDPLDVSVTEWRISPDDVHAAAGPLLIVVHNSGRLAHNLVLSRDGVSVSATQPILPGQDADILATVQRGSYRLESSLVDDEATGVYGTLHVG